LTPEQRNTLVMGKLSLAGLEARAAHRRVRRYIDYHDLFSEAVLVMLRRAGDFDPSVQPSFGHFIRPVISHGLSDYIRRHLRWTRFAEDDRPHKRPTRSLSNPALLVDGRPAPIDAAVMAEEGSRADDVWEAVDALSPREKLVFTVRHREGAKYAHIAATLGITEGACRKIYTRAVASLRLRLRKGD
jgi:RNA polymerase sigma factor (sigma-70 family)